MRQPATGYPQGLRQGRKVDDPAFFLILLFKSLRLLSFRLESTEFRGYRVVNF